MPQFMAVFLTPQKEGLYPCFHCLVQESIATTGDLGDISQKKYYSSGLDKRFKTDSITALGNVPCPSFCTGSLRFIPTVHQV